MNILVTGGAGYIGSHTVVELLAAGHEVVIVDNFANSQPEVLKRIKEISGKDIVFYEADATDFDDMKRIVREEKIDAAIHFAGLKAVGESVEKPIMYYMNNLVSTMAVANALASIGAKKLIFSSSATVYGDPHFLPYTEDHPVKPSNPYGQTKLFSEQILRDIAVADPEWNISLLRYFNPIGAHKSGHIGEDPSGIPNNLLPYLAQVAVGKRTHLDVFGDDYDTIDGTGVRDYLHVVDLAKAHVRALERDTELGVTTLNLGTGKGHSVLEVIAAFEAASGQTIPYRISKRRAGDLPEYYADATLAKELIGWKAELGLADMCEDTWRWQSQNPNGYAAD